jgi:hypothetical protein
VRCLPERAPRIGRTIERYAQRLRKQPALTTDRAMTQRANLAAPLNKARAYAEQATSTTIRAPRSGLGLADGAFGTRENPDMTSGVS